MASLSDSRAVKSLNNGPGRKRFVFKTFSQRIEEVDINVFRSLHAVKSVSEGSSFFMEGLMEWRELNTAKDFMSFYDTVMPKAQTLTLVILHKELIVSEVLTRLTMGARLSLEPLLDLFPALARDVLDDFLPFLPRIVSSFYSLLQSGADKEPEIIEQMFTSWSNIMMHLQRYLVEDIVYALEVTTPLRCYTKEYIRVFMAEAVSFLLRKVPVHQHGKAVQKILSETVENPTYVMKSAASVLLFHSLRGTFFMLHSDAIRMLQLLLDPSTFDFCDRTDGGSETLIEILASMFQKLCKAEQMKKIRKLWSLLYNLIRNSARDYRLLHLSFLLSVLVAATQNDKHHKIFSHKGLPSLVDFLLEMFFMNNGTELSWDSRDLILEKVLHLMLYVLHGLRRSNDEDAMNSAASRWSGIFRLRSKSFQGFVEELLSGDPSVVYIFRFNIVSVLDGLIEDSRQDAVHLMLRLCQKLELKSFQSVGLSEAGDSGVFHFLHEAMHELIELVVGHRNSSTAPFTEDTLALLWAIIRCYRYMSPRDADKMLLIDCIDVVGERLTVNLDDIDGISRSLWEGLIAASISSYSNLFGSENPEFELAMKLVRIAQVNKSSSHVLHAVADFFDLWKSTPVSAGMEESCSMSHVLDGAVHELTGNLCHTNKCARVSALRILIHCETFGGKSFSVADSGQKELETDVSVDATAARKRCCDVLGILYMIEATPLSVSTSRKITGLISQIHVGLTAGRIPKSHLCIVLNAMIGLLHNRFGFIWPSAVGCVTTILCNHDSDVWDLFIHFFEDCQSRFLDSKAEPDIQPTGFALDRLLVLFREFVHTGNDCSPPSTVLSTLLQCLQKIPDITESHFRRMLTSFFMFLGYSDDPSDVRSFKASCCKRKEWSSVLKEWLDLLRINLRDSCCSHFLKQVLVRRLLNEHDTETQMRALDCLLTWKDDFLLPYADHLHNLINSSTPREEFVKWNLSEESTFIAQKHREEIIPLVFSILMPKIRKLRQTGSRKKTNINLRKAMLSMIAQVNVGELSSFFALLVEPLQLLFSHEACSSQFDLNDLLEYFGSDRFVSRSWKKVFGFLHVISDVLGVFDASRLNPFLDFISGCAVRVLRGSISLSEDGEARCSATDDKKTSPVNVKQLKEIRTLCLKIISHVLCNFGDRDFSEEFWDLFFVSVRSLIQNLKQEGIGTEKPSSLLCCFVAMSKNRNLLSMLSRDETVIPSVFSALSNPTASHLVVRSVLDFIGNLLSAGDQTAKEVKHVLVGNTETLVCSLHKFFVQRKTVGPSGEIALGVFKLLAPHLEDHPSLASKFTEALLPFVRMKDVSPFVLSEVFNVFATVAPLLDGRTKSKLLNAVTPILAVSGADVRASVCDLLDSLALIDPALANLIRDLNAAEFGEIDYDTVLGAYDRFGAEFFHNLPPDPMRVLLSLFACHLSSADLALRQSALRSMLLFVEFCSSSPSHWTDASVLSVVKRCLLKHVIFAMRGGEAFGYSEWIQLLREMILKLPDSTGFSPFRTLCSSDAEEDFFCNVVHLQKHRQVKALLRFRTAAGDSDFPQAMTCRLFVPLFFRMLFDSVKEHVRNACIETLALVSGRLDWDGYRSLLDRCFRELSSRPDHKKMLFRLVCSVLDRFHFDGGIPSIGKRLRESFFVKMLGFLGGDDSGGVSTGATLAAVKLLRLISGDFMESQIPSIVRRTCGFLASRNESARDNARSVLASTLKELGASCYLPCVLSILRSVLKKGHELHILGYTVNFILSRLDGETIDDGCIDDLLSIVKADVFADESEVVVKRTKEARKTKSFELLQIVARNVAFNSVNAAKLLSPVISSVSCTPSSKLDSMLHHIAIGIEGNPSVRPSDLFTFIHDAIGDPRLSGFALRILQNRLKNASRDADFLLRLDPFVGVLAGLLRSDNAVLDALRCLTLLSRFPLPSVRSHSGELKAAALDLIRRLDGSSAPLCLKLLTSLLRRGDVTLSEEQLRDLVRCPLFADLETRPSPPALSLLKAVVARGLVVGDVYDLARRVGRMTVTSESGSVRRTCGRILLKFLLHFRMSKKRRQQHIDSVLANVGFDRPEGRESALEMLHSIIVKFPSGVVEEQSHAFFLVLVTCLVNDAERRIRSMAGAALRRLFKRMSSQFVNSALDYAISWYDGVDTRLRSAAAQVLGLLVEVADIRKHTGRLLPVLKRVLSSTAAAEGGGLWKEAYYSLVMLEKMMRRHGDGVVDDDDDNVRDSVVELLVHPHAWLRAVSGRVVALYFQKGAMKATSTFDLAVRFCRQLERARTDASERICDNLGFAIWSLHGSVGAGESVRSFWSAVDPSDRDRFLKALHLFGDRGMFDSFAHGAVGVRDDDARIYLVSRLLHRIGSIAIAADAAQVRVAVFGVLGAIARKLGGDDCGLYVGEMLRPVYRVCEGCCGRRVEDEEAGCARDARDVIRDVVGVPLFVKAYCEIGKGLRSKREKRKREEKLLSVINPSLGAKRKLWAAAKHRTAKKRRVLAVRKRPRSR